MDWLRGGRGGGLGSVLGRSDSCLGGRKGFSLSSSGLLRLSTKLFIPVMSEELRVTDDGGCFLLGLGGGLLPACPMLVKLSVLEVSTEQELNVCLRSLSRFGRGGLTGVPSVLPLG